MCTKNGVFGKFEFPAHASDADETLVSFAFDQIDGGITLQRVGIASDKLPASIWPDDAANSIASLSY
jgi:hypothetical protein